MAMEEVRNVGDARELTLRGPHISKAIEENGLDEKLFELTNLNYLCVSQTCLKHVSPRLGNLVNLTNLVLHHNQLTALPEEIQCLTKLKFLDLSNNQIEELPLSITKLANLESLNVSVNKLLSFPPVNEMKSLHILNISHNNLKELPEGIFDPELVHLHTIMAGNNEMEHLSPTVTDLPHLQTLDLTNNKLKEVPAELSVCPKLKTLSLTGNKFSDRRFGKLVEQCLTKAVMEYLNKNLKKEKGQNPDKKAKGKNTKLTKKDLKKEEDDDVEFLTDALNVLHFPDKGGLVVSVTPAVLSVRPYIVCCIVRNLDFQKTSNSFKQFITLQTKLHDTLCNKRQAATIATHDLKSVKGPLKFDAQFPSHLMIIPLSRQKEVTGEKLVEDLLKEAEALRKEKKRSTVSGIHKYLDLLKDKIQYPCLLDCTGAVISFPPITNSNNTKISKETTSILVEVTSSTNLDVCKKVCDELLVKMLEMGLGENSTGEEASSSPAQKTLTVEQVKVNDEEGNLRVVYPSRTDLNHPGIKVNRNYE
ncbi:leucine-rich repeat-containing protein 47-like isoform X1 [Saccostrea cucullata]|uniref:leucine-rich repeat-containing protein 47-like isoform X1 n=1 Tax=Saccostrea cuccullata TaxID=36930 RepID=UPI002ED1ECD0